MLDDPGSRRVWQHAHSAVNQTLCSVKLALLLSRLTVILDTKRNRGRVPLRFSVTPKKPTWALKQLFPAAY